VLIQRFPRIDHVRTVLRPKFADPIPKGANIETGNGCGTSRKHGAARGARIRHRELGSFLSRRPIWVDGRHRPPRTSEAKKSTPHWDVTVGIRETFPRKAETDLHDLACPDPGCRRWRRPRQDGGALACEPEVRPAGGIYVYSCQCFSTESCGRRFRRFFCADNGFSNRRA